MGLTGLFVMAIAVAVGLALVRAYERLASVERSVSDLSRQLARFEGRLRLKFAFDRGWVPIEIRLMASSTAGLSLTGLGWWLRARRRDFALVIQGGGIGIVYLTVFAASANLYDLISAGTATAMMVVLVALASALAVLQDARALAVLATAGGFLAPVLVSSGGSHVALFGYYLVLDLGILGVAWFRAWRILNLLGFVFTFVIASAWGARYYQPEFFPGTEPFLIAFFLLYVAIPIAFSMRTAVGEGRRKPGEGLVDGTLVFGTPLVAFGLQHALVGDTEYGLAISSVAAALLYAALATSLSRRNAAVFGLLVEVFVSLAVVFGTIAIPLALEARWTVVGWALEGAGLVWVGMRQQQVLAWVAGLAMQVSAAGAFFVALALSATPETPVANGIFMAAVLLAIAGFSSAWHLRRDFLPEFGSVVLVWGLLWWFGAGWNEIATFVPPMDRFHADLLFTTLSLTALGILRGRIEWRGLALPVAALLPAMLLSALALFATREHPFSLKGVAVWGVAFASEVWWLRRQDELGDWPPLLTRLWHTGTLWLALFLVSWEAAWITEQLGGSSPAWRMVAWILPSIAVLPVIPILVGRASTGRGWMWPLRSHADTYLQSLALPAVLAALWVLGASFGPGDPSPLPYVPVLNPIELVQIGALLVLGRWCASAPVSIRMWASPRFPPLPATIGLGFIVLNGMIARATHFLGGVPFSIDDLWQSATYQTVTSIAWTVLALVVMVTATGSGRRALWGLGGGLLGLVVLKLFMVDLAGIGTVARIVSFLVVGTLILLIGYLSPIPPRSREENTP